MSVVSLHATRLTSVPSEVWDNGFVQSAMSHPTLTSPELIPASPVILDLACGFGHWCILAARYFKVKLSSIQTMIFLTWSRIVKLPVSTLLTFSPILTAQVIMILHAKYHGFMATCNYPPNA